MKDIGKIFGWGSGEQQKFDGFMLDLQTEIQTGVRSKRLAGVERVARQREKVLRQKRSGDA